MHSSPASNRALRRLAVAFGFGLLLSFVPLPGLVFSTASVGATTPLPALEPASPEDVAAVQAVSDEPVGTDRVAGAEESVAGFTTIGITFDTPPDQPVFVRVKDAGGTFGEWRELAVEADEGPDGSTDAGTQPFWVGEGTGYEVNLGTEDATDADVVVVRDEQRRSTVVATPAAGAAAPVPFGITSRAGWGARAPPAPATAAPSSWAWCTTRSAPTTTRRPTSPACSAPSRRTTWTAGAGPTSRTTSWSTSTAASGRAGAAASTDP